ncbi:FtsK/SpoIIIE domain-containing protein [Kitasatospora sp. NPDC127116]|uniref:FtsK/SpoIIIE domain-containing protein n=1 Tax=Kitasatospora sp. NPDC127116 TaxID=3345367 RepID=UPI003625018F
MAASSFAGRAPPALSPPPQLPRRIDPKEAPVAQQFTPAGADNVLPFLPRPQRAQSVEQATTATTMPTTTTVLETRPAETRLVEDLVASSSPAVPPVQMPLRLPVQAKLAISKRLFAACVAVANRAGAHMVRYRMELAPAAVVGAVSGLGWWQYLAGVGGWGAAAYASLAVLSGAGAFLGIERKNDLLIRAGCSGALTFADVATAVGAGPGGISLTATAVTTGAAYAVYVPWLIKYRKDHKQLPSKATATANATASIDVQVQMDKGQTALKAAASSTGSDLSTENGRLVPSSTSIGLEEEEATVQQPDLRTSAGPFHNDVIPYADDDSDDVAKPIRIGWDEYGRPVYLTLMYRHTLVAGASDWGKSGIINLIIKKLFRKQHVELFGIDMKPGAVELGPWEPKMQKLARTPEEARDLLQFIRAECDRRGARLEELSKQSLAAGGPAVRKWIPGVHGPAWFVITDELAELIRQDEVLRKQEAELRKFDPDMGPAEQDVATTYESLLAIARNNGIMFVSATQQPSAKVFGGNTDARGNYGNRISTRVGEAGHSAFIFGQGCKGNGFAPERLQRPGEFYLGCPEMPLTNPPRCRSEYVSDEDIAADVAHLHANAPVREPVGRFAPQSRTAARTEQLSIAYPDGQALGRDDFPGLYKVFLQLCEDQGYATKADLVENGPFSSPDTARRALEVWGQHGILAEKVGPVRRFSLPPTHEA